MPDDETLLAKLAFQFSVQQENVAVEALAHVLTRSSVARAAVADLLALSEAEGLGDLVYRTQAAAGGEGRPDLVGFDAEGRELLLIEAKFWAGLTVNQPVAYLERLPVVRGAGLLFVAPAARLPSLWSELVGLCTAAGLMVEGTVETDGDGVSLAALEDGRWLGITSWRHLLDLLIARLDEAGASSAASDARQLAGLCDRMDEEEFLPLAPGELAPAIPRRILQLHRLVDEVIDALLREGVVAEGRSGGSNPHWYGRYLRRGDVGLWLGLWYELWAKVRPTPPWLDLEGSDDASGLSYRGRFADLEHAAPAGVVVHDGRLLFPLGLPVAVERQAVVDAIVAQVRRVALRLG